jgi:HAD superfamily hydrolase (TIGR01484 family)
MANALLICTDLDGTLIAKGTAGKPGEARARFDALVARPEIILAYVSGRHLALVQQAIDEYRLPVPDYIIADVGTSIYHPDERGCWKNQDAWQREIAHDWGGKSAADLHACLRVLPGLDLQEASNQGRYKLSYRFPVEADAGALAQRAGLLLGRAGVRARVIASLDEAHETGLLDIVPERASKLHAIEALMRELGIASNKVLFSGDSGNDLEVLASPIPSVLVANASAEIKQRARELAHAAGHADTLHIATGGFLGMNGCHCAGILEGIARFYPHTRAWLESADPASHPSDPSRLP